MSVRLSVAIQTHPRRLSHARELAGRLAPLPVDVVVDPAPDPTLPNPWRTYRKALEETPDWATHRLIVQDDATPCLGFAEAAPRAVASVPGACVAFFHSSRPRENLHRLAAAEREGSPLAGISVRQFAPVIALSWPAEVICPCVCWTYEQGWPETFRADDQIVGLALAAHDVPVYATVPSLVQHEDVLPSLIRRRHYERHGPAHPTRTAHRFLTPPSDAREIAWP